MPLETSEEVEVAVTPPVGLYYFNYGFSWQSIESAPDFRNPRLLSAGPARIHVIESGASVNDGRASTEFAVLTLSEPNE